MPLAAAALDATSDATSEAALKVALAAALRIGAQLAPNATMAVAYDGQFGSKTKDHAGSVQVRVRF